MNLSAGDVAAIVGSAVAVVALLGAVIGFVYKALRDQITDLRTTTERGIDAITQRLDHGSRTDHYSLNPQHVALLREVLDSTRSLRPNHVEELQQQVIELLHEVHELKRRPAKGPFRAKKPRRSAADPSKSRRFEDE